jgi:hypothetical protein
MVYRPLTGPQMISWRIATVRPIRAALPIARRAIFVQQRGIRAEPEYPTLVSGASHFIVLEEFD